MLYAKPPRPLGRGFSNDIVGIQLLDAPPTFSGPLVIRVTHDDEEAVRESIIQHGVARAGFPAPPVLMRGSTRSKLGRPFMISPLRAGANFTTLLRSHSALAAFRRLPHQLSETMVALHKVPTEGIAAGLEAAGWPAFRLDSLAVLSAVETRVGALESPQFDAAATWLRANTPDFAPAVVCHGDLHPMNLLFDGKRVVAVLDWELARLADPAFDVARTVMLLRMAPYPMSNASRRVMNSLAGRLAKSFVESYEAERPLDKQSVEWHEALHCLRTLTMAAQGATEPEQSRLRRVADVWLPIAPKLQHRLAQIIAPPRP